MVYGNQRDRYFGLRATHVFLTFVSEPAGGMAAKPTATREAITAPARTNRAVIPKPATVGSEVIL